MKKKMTALLIFFSLMLLMIPSVASATTTIFRDGDENLTAVNIDKIYYYDIYQGIDANRANVNNNVKFLGDVIKSSYVQPGGSGANVGMLDYWSQLAFLIFQDNSLYAANLNAGGGFAKNMGNAAMIRVTPILFTACSIRAPHTETAKQAKTTLGTAA